MSVALRFVCLACDQVLYSARVPKRCRCGGCDYGIPAATQRALDLDDEQESADCLEDRLDSALRSDEDAKRVRLSESGLSGLPLRIADARLRYSPEYRCVIDGRKTIIVRG